MQSRRRLIGNEQAATAIEYGLIASLISVGMIMAFQMLGLNLITIFQTIADTLGGALGRP